MEMAREMHRLSRCPPDKTACLDIAVLFLWASFCAVHIGLFLSPALHGVEGDEVDDLPDAGEDDGDAEDDQEEEGEELRQREGERGGGGVHLVVGVVSVVVRHRGGGGGGGGGLGGGNCSCIAVRPSVRRRGFGPSLSGGVSEGRLHMDPRLQNR